MTNNDNLPDSIKEILAALSEGIMCPSCNNWVCKPFHNLGEKFNWAEGCARCADES